MKEVIKINKECKSVYVAKTDDGKTEVAGITRFGDEVIISTCKSGSNPCTVSISLDAFAQIRDALELNYPTDADMSDMARSENSE